MPYRLFLSMIAVLLVSQLDGNSQAPQPAIEPELRVEGRLTDKDPKDKVIAKSPHKVHEFTMKAGIVYVIEMSSKDFDTYLRLENSKGEPLAANDDVEPKNLNSRIVFKALKDDTHRIIATAYRGTGAYVLTVRKGAAAEFDQKKALLAQADQLTEAGMRHVREGLYSQAEPMLRKALDIHREFLGEESTWTLGSYGNMGMLLNRQGKYAEAEKFARKALALSLTLERSDPISLAFRYNNLAVILSRQGKYAEAEHYHRLAQENLRKDGDEDSPWLADSYNSLAFDLREQGQLAEGELLTRKALAIFQKTLGEEFMQTAGSYHNVALFALSRGRPQEAEQLHRKALAVCLRLHGADHPFTLSGTSVLAADLRRQGRFAESAKLMEKVLVGQRKALGDKHPAISSSLVSLATDWYGLGEYDKARTLALEAAAGFQGVRVEVGFSGLDRAGYAADHSPMPWAAALLARHGAFSEAWKLLEENLARGLLDDISARALRRLTPAEQQHEERLLAQLAELDREIEKSKKVELRIVAQFGEKRDRLMAELLQFHSDVREKYGVAAGQVFPRDRIQKHLSPTTAFLTWLDLAGHGKAKDPSGEHWGVIVRQRGDPVWVKLTGTGPEQVWCDKDDELPRKVLEVLHKFDPDTDHVSWLKDLARQRLRPLLEHLDGITQLIVLPSSAMAGVPVEALNDRFQVSYAPSGTMYAWLKENRKPFPAQTGQLLALADPVFSEDDGKVLVKNDAPVTRLLRDRIRPLPGTRGEVEAIARLIAAKGGKVEKLVGAQANGTNLDRLVSKKELIRFRYLHLATHGYPDPRGGMNSYLALTSEDLSLTSHGKLTAGHMLRTWKLNADLVTLSACQTGLGEFQGGEGYIGFAQALFLSGAQSLVLSLWPVHDWSTTILMERFYENLLGARASLKEPLSKVEALAESKRYLRALNRQEVIGRLKALQIPFDESNLVGQRPFEHSHFWAAFILVGDPATR